MPTQATCPPGLISDAGVERLRRADVLMLLGVTALGLVLRLSALGHESIWYDEAASMDMAKQSCADLLSGRHPDDGNPAGYFFLLHAWLRFWGSSSIETARALSGVAGALAVPAVWLLAQATGMRRRAAWLACLLVALSPPLVYLGQEARVFALFATVATVAAALTARIERYDRIAAWLGFTATGMILVHLHYYAFFVLVALGVYLLAWAWPRGWRPVLKLIASASVIALAFAPWLPTFLWQLHQGTERSGETWRQQLAIFPLFSIAGRTLVWKDTGLSAVMVLDVALIMAVFLPLAWLLFRWRAGPRLVVAFVVGVTLTAVLVSVALSPMIHVHYLSVLLPAVLLLVACALEAGWRHRSWLLMGAPAILLALLMPMSLVRLYAVPHKNDWRGVADLIARQGPELPVYFHEDIGAAPFGYYRPEQPCRRLSEPFGADGSRWQQVHYFERMRAEPEGFWIVLYATNRTSRLEEPSILKRIARAFQIQDEEEFPSIHVLLCRPLAAKGEKGNALTSRRTE